MGLLKKIQGFFHDDWCSKCQSEMHENLRQLYALPVMVGQYEHQEEVEYFTRRMQKVGSKEEIPSGMYACDVVAYQCPACGYKVVKLTVFLPVRAQEKFEDVYFFEKGELDRFIWEN